MSDTLAELFDTHHPRLYRLARRLMADREEARDLVQETFLRAARRPGSVPAGDGAEPWLVRVLVNLCRDRERALAVRRREAQHERPTEVDPASGPDARVLARESVRAALADLAPRRRAVVVLRELEELDVATIARQLGVTQVTVRWHLAAGRRQLARRLAPQTASIPLTSVGAKP